MLMVIAITAALAPPAWRLTRIAAVIMERIVSGRWPDFSDAVFRSNAMLQWMVRPDRRVLIPSLRPCSQSP